MSSRMTRAPRDSARPDAERAAGPRAHAPTGPAAHARPGDGAHARRPIPPFTPEHEEFRSVVRRFVQTELAPRAPEWEDARWFPNEVFGRLAELGYIGLKFPESYGGSDDPVADAVFAEEMAWCGSGGLAAGVGATAESRCRRSGALAPRIRSSASWCLGSAARRSPRWRSPSPAP